MAADSYIIIISLDSIYFLGYLIVISLTLYHTKAKLDFSALVILIFYSIYLSLQLANYIVIFAFERENPDNKAIDSLVIANGFYVGDYITYSLVFLA